MTFESLHLSLQAFVRAVEKKELIECSFLQNSEGIYFIYRFKMRVLPDGFVYNLGIDSKRSLIEHLIQANETQALEAVFDCLNVPKNLLNSKDKIAYLELVGELK